MPDGVNRGLFVPPRSSRNCDAKHQGPEPRTCLVRALPVRALSDLHERVLLAAIVTQQELDFIDQCRKQHTPELAIVARAKQRT